MNGGAILLLWLHGLTNPATFPGKKANEKIKMTIAAAYALLMDLTLIAVSLD
jgi:hypothetical protein